MKIYLPEVMPKNVTELLVHVDKAHVNKISSQELTKLIKWFKEPSRVKASLNNFDASWVAWYLEHPED